jgi:nucleoside-diphosphate-sugar epimerase
MNILITGGAGFIGSHLCERLLMDGNHVVCVDNFLTGSKKNIQHLLKNKNFHFIKFDVIKPITHYPLPITHYDIVYHLASPASPNAESPYSYMAYPIKTLLVNSLGTKNLLELARNNNARFIFASSSEIYGNPEEHPQTENYWGNVNPNGVRSCYDEGKRFGEAITMAYFRKYRTSARIARIFNTYGPRMLPEDGRVISNFIVQSLRSDPITVYGDGEQTRSFCYVSDMIDGLIELGKKDNIDGEVINIGNPDERKVLDVAQLIKKMTKTASLIAFQNLPKDDPTRRQPCIDKAEKLLNWKPKITLEEGLRKTIDYFFRYAKKN